MTGTEILAALERGELSSVEVVKSLHERADAVEPKVNGFAHQFRQQALAEAERCDEERARGQVRGPLHGLPISVKENIDTQGLASTLGVEGRLVKVADKDAVTVQLAKASGAIVLGKTNVPQALLSPMQCENPVFGATHNPWALTHGPGGSSSGEGAVIASGSSVLGFGTDLGGSIRFPASYCGIVGFKPTSNRWSNQGATSALAGQELVKAQMGPMARSVDDIILLMKALDSPKHWPLDPRVPPLPLGDPDAIDVSKLRIGYFDNDGFITPAASVLRAHTKALDILSDLGAELVHMPPVHQREVVQLYVGGVSSDGMKTLRGLLQDEKIVDANKVMWRAGHLPLRLRHAVGKMLPMLGQARMADLVSSIGEKDVATFWSLVAKRSQFQRAAFDAWEKAGVDVVVCPGGVTPAVPDGMGHDFSMVFSYFGRYNLFGMPAGVVPMTTVQPHETTRQTLQDRIDKRAAAVEAQSLGLPVSVQVVGLPWNDAPVLATMKTLQRAARSRQFYPLTPVQPA